MTGHLLKVNIPSFLLLGSLLKWYQISDWWHRAAERESSYHVQVKFHHSLNSLFFFSLFNSKLIIKLKILRNKHVEEIFLTAVTILPYPKKTKLIIGILNQSLLKISSDSFFYLFGWETNKWIINWGQILLLASMFLNLIMFLNWLNNWGIQQQSSWLLKKTIF